jgi:hypothetical protein
MANGKPRAVALLIACSTLPGCGGAAEPPPAQTPPLRPVARESPPPKSAVDSAPRHSGDASAPSAPSGSKQPEEGAVKLTSQPHEIITGETTSYSFNFAASDVHGAAEEKCRAKVGDDPQGLAECMTKAREKFGITVLRFVKKNKLWWWLTYERRGSQLITLHRIPFEFGAETDHSVTLRPTGKDVGLAPLARVPREVVIRLPNDSSIELDDPAHGKLVYDAKIGMVQ